MLDQAALRSQLKRLLVTSLHLEGLTPDNIGDDVPLFGDGLGLDSIDALELALAISKQYGFELRSDDDNNPRIFASLRNLAQHIDSRRAG